MSIRGNLIGTTQKPEQVLLRSKSLTEEQKTQARENVGAAPAGYGIGSNSKKITDDLNNAVVGGVYYYDDDGVVKNIPTDIGSGVVFVERYGTAQVLQTIKDVRGRIVERHGKVQNGVWAFDPPEYVNPPFYPSTEYRTTDRIDGKAVYKKMDASGKILYRLDGETEWKTQHNLVGSNLSTSQLLSKDGWYRVGKISIYNSYRLSVSTIFDTNSDHCSIVDIAASYAHPAMRQITAKTHHNTAIHPFVIDQVRLVPAPSAPNSYYYVDIHYNNTDANRVNVFISGSEDRFEQYKTFTDVTDENISTDRLAVISLQIS